MSLTDEQKEIRRTRIGSTDIAAIVALYRPELAHLAKKQNATDVWLRLVHGVTQKQNSSMSRGIRVEPILRETYRAIIGPLPDPPGTLVHNIFNFACASPDGLTSNMVVEFKTCSNWIKDRWGEPSTDKIPDDYNLQVQWILEVCNRSSAQIMVAFGDDVKDDSGADFFNITGTSCYIVNKSEDLCLDLLKKANDFTDEYVASDMPPPMAPLHNKRIFKRIIKENKNGNYSEWVDRNAALAKLNSEAERSTGESTALDIGSEEGIS